MAVARKKAEKVTIDRIKHGSVTIIAMGGEFFENSELIIHKWSEKAKTQIRDKQAQKTKLRSRPIRDPQAECEAALYRMPNGEPAISGVSFKKSIESEVMTNVEGVNGTEVKKNIHVPDDLIQIHGDWYMREDTVTLGGVGSPSDLRYRPGFPKWWASVTISYNEEKFTQEEVVALLSRAGYSSGLGDFRVGKSGHNFGRFKIATLAEAKKAMKQIPAKRKSKQLKK